MAKNIGPIQLTGKIGNLSARETKYGNIISTPGGFKGDRIKTEERYEATRQLGSEFGRCSKISSQLYTTLQPYLKSIPHPHLYGIIQSLVATIKGYDTTSPKGERCFGMGLQTEEGLNILQHYSFNPKKNLGSVMAQYYAVTLEEGKLTFPDFDCSRIYFPREAEHLGLQLVLMRLDADVPLCTMTTSTLTRIAQNERKKDLTFEAPIPEGNGFLLALLYFGFCYEMRGEVRFLQHEHNVLEVVGVQ